MIPTQSESVEVRQQPYRFRMAVTQDVTSKTFVICEQSKVKHVLTVNSQIPMVYFALDSAVILPATAESILSNLGRNSITQKITLSVTGYTCALGTESGNHELSLQRAITVTDFLRDHGFTVGTVQGKGALNPITNNPQKFYKNRRVEITTHPLRQ
ncbi:OmpA family protein [Desulfogranum marinum]|uniref:OmpA family protein n=1 Tax=Desulfogranum marinum TaxID=453220 RepID=UPI0029C84B3B|nr:OmpA family protein [Desulfogranum marinum]